MHPDRASRTARSCAQRRVQPCARACGLAAPGPAPGEPHEPDVHPNLPRSGRWPTLFASFLHFDFCFAIRGLNGAMGPFIGESFDLTPAQKGSMASAPILAGAPMRFPPGGLARVNSR